MEREKKMPRLIDAEKLVEYKASGVSELTEWQRGWNDAIDTIMNETPPIDAETVEWIPITARPMDTEERLEWSEKLGYDLEDDEAMIYTSQLPDDGQEVLVCGYGRVWIDKFMSDPDYGCYFVENGDMDGIVAWMPLPKPYGEEEREDV